MSRITRFYVDGAGNYLGGWQERPPLEEGGPALPPDFPPGAIEVPSAPAHAAQKWSGTAWGPAPVQEAPLTVEALAAALETKGVLSKAEIDAEKGKK